MKLTPQDVRVRATPRGVKHYLLEVWVRDMYITSLSKPVYVTKDRAKLYGEELEGELRSDMRRVLEGIREEIEDAVDRAAKGREAAALADEEVTELEALFD
jgi:uncharacterized membrane protein